MNINALRKELLQPELTRPDWVKSSVRDGSVVLLDRNENTDTTYLNFLKSMVTDSYISLINQYPECALLYQKLAKNVGVSPESLFLGAGSDGVIRYVFEAFISPGDSVIITDPSFAMYVVYSQLFGAQCHKIGYIKNVNALELDVEHLLQTIHEQRPKVVFLPNPDSPTGTVLSEQQIIAILKTAAEVGAFLFIDEAYYPFSDVTVLPLLQTFSNLIVARTFSKAWGLAGARVGYAIARPELMHYLHKVRPMYEIGAMSAAVVYCALDYEAEMLRSVQRLNAGKAYFKNAMESLGFQTLISLGNFQHVAFGALATEIHLALSNLVLYRQDFPGTVLAGYSRFSATTEVSFSPIIERIQAIVDTHNITLNAHTVSKLFQGEPSHGFS